VIYSCPNFSLHQWAWATYHVSCEPLRIFWNDDTTCSTWVPCVLPTPGWIPGFSTCSGQHAWHSCRAGCIVISENSQGLATHMVHDVVMPFIYWWAPISTDRFGGKLRKRKYLSDFAVSCWQTSYFLCKHTNSYFYIRLSCHKKSWRDFDAPHGAAAEIKRSLLVWNDVAVTCTQTSSIHRQYLRSNCLPFVFYLSSPSVTTAEPGARHIT